METSELRTALARLDQTALFALRQLMESPDEEVAAAAALWARYRFPLRVFITAHSRGICRARKSR
jgi:hypothetical protein